MRKEFALATVLVAFALAVAPSASAAVSTSSLEKRVASLEKQVKSLQQTVNHLSSETALNYVGDACLAANTADALQGTWLVLDQVAQTALAKTFFGAQTAIDDKSACSNINVTRVPPPALSSVVALVGLIGWLI